VDRLETKRGVLRVVLEEAIGITRLLLDVCGK
jgi:hypothetical protein